MKNLIVGLLVFGLLACASAEKDAREKLETGDYAGAAEIFEKIVRKEPENAEAKEGLRRAREGVIGDRLISVRKARTSANADSALDQLLEIHSLEKAWGVYPAEAARFTQDEETAFAWKPFVERVEIALRAKQPLRAETLWMRYGPVFASGKSAQPLDALSVHIVRAGKSRCEDLVGRVGRHDPYYAGFVARYCRHWKASARPAAGIEKGRLRDLIGAVAWTGKIDGTSDAQMAIVRKTLEDGLRGTAWFDPAGAKRLPVSLAGASHFSHTKTMVTRVKEYDEDEAYETTETVTKTRSVPYDATVTEVDPVDGQLKTRTVQKVREESYLDSEPVVRHRSVRRQFPYSALYHEQAIDWSGTLTAPLGTQTLTVNASKRDTAQGDEQQLTNVQAGLAPMHPILIDPLAWTGSASQDWARDFAGQLRKE